MDEYAADKLQFLKNLYDFDENDDINTFTAKLTGKNKGRRRYAEATDYADRVAAVFRSFKDGGIIKYQQAGKVLLVLQKRQDRIYLVNFRLIGKILIGYITISLRTQVIILL